MICSECKQETSATCNGKCPDCFNVAQAAWEKKMAIRQPPEQFDMKKLLGVLLTEHWMHECKIDPAYMPPYPGADTRPTCQVHYVREDGSQVGLRYSAGPLQGYFWDAYGDDMHSPELALVAISKAPPPWNVSVVPTRGRP